MKKRWSRPDAGSIVPSPAASWPGIQLDDSLLLATGIPNYSLFPGGRGSRVRGSKIRSCFDTLPFAAWRFIPSTQLKTSRKRQTIKLESGQSCRSCLIFSSKGTRTRRNISGVDRKGLSCWTGPGRRGKTGRKAFSGDRRYSKSRCTPHRI